VDAFRVVISRPNAGWEPFEIRLKHAGCGGRQEVFRSPGLVAASRPYPEVDRQRGSRIRVFRPLC
jgi:hypothetical protein